MKSQFNMEILPDRQFGRRGFTLVELLVVITIIGILVSLMMPAIQIARESARQASCSSNLRQFGLGFAAHAETYQDRFCSGAFDWQRDGCVTEVGWVADLVNKGSLVGSMLCPTNPHRLSEGYESLYTFTPAGTGVTPCLNYLGTQPTQSPDGLPIVNPCREIYTTSLAAGDVRSNYITKKIFAKHYNTNYTASWFLVRGGVKLDGNGNLAAAPAGCAADPDPLLSRYATTGPLTRADLDASDRPAAIIPMLGDGSPAGTPSQPKTLPYAVGSYAPGQTLVRSFTGGPRLTATLLTPGGFASGTAGTVWWPVWNNSTRQDYRGFAAVHRSNCNILFADGSVRPIADTSGDGLINTGFALIPDSGFNSNELEASPDELESYFSLSDSVVP